MITRIIIVLCAVLTAGGEVIAENTPPLTVSAAVMDTILMADSQIPAGKAYLTMDWMRLDTNKIWGFSPDGKIEEFRTSKKYELAFDGDRIRYEARYRTPNPRGGKFDIWETQAFDGDKLEVFVVWTEERTNETKSEGAIYDSDYLNTDGIDPRTRGQMNGTTVSDFLRGTLKPWVLSGVEGLGVTVIDSLDCHVFAAEVAANGDSVYVALAPSWAYRPRRMTIISREVRQVTDYRFSRENGVWVPTEIDIETDRIDPANGRVTPYTSEKLVYEYTEIAVSLPDSLFRDVFPEHVVPDNRRRGSKPLEQ